MSCIAIITARGGSKRIPRKNIKDFLGKPIIAFSIEAAIASELFEEVMVSTDDLEIAELSQKYGAKVPFMRSAKNSDDYATTSDVLLEVLAEYQKRGRSFEYGCCLYPTAPFVTAEKLRKAYDFLIQGSYDCIFPVSKYKVPIEYAIRCDGQRVEFVFPEAYRMRTQDIQPTFYDVGQFYFFRVASILDKKSLLTNNISVFSVSELEANDIDDEEDWIIAELKFRWLRLQGAIKE